VGKVHPLARLAFKAALVAVLALTAVLLILAAWATSKAKVALVNETFFHQLNLTGNTTSDATLRQLVAVYLESISYASQIIDAAFRGLLIATLAATLVLLGEAVVASRC